MKRQFYLLFILLFIVSFSYSQDSKSTGSDKNYRFYNVEGDSISQATFNKEMKSYNYWMASSDSLKTRKLIPRKIKGTIENIGIFIDNLEFITREAIDRDNPIIIIYYPGPDPCNTSGSATHSTLKTWHTKLKNGTKRIAKTEPIYICKNFEGLKKYDKIVKWHKDIGQTIENLFFQYHYPCSSFVIINSKGEYFSSFGEFGKEYVWKVLKKIK